MGKQNEWCDPEVMTVFGRIESSQESARYKFILVCRCGDIASDQLGKALKILLKILPVSSRDCVTK